MGPLQDFQLRIALTAIDLPDPIDPYLRQHSHRVSPNYLRQIKGILFL